MSEFFSHWQNQINQRELRERVLILLALLALLFVIWQGTLQGPLAASLNADQARIASLKSQISTAETELAALKALASGDPDFPLRRSRDALRQEIDQLDANLLELTHGLVSAQMLPQVLQDVLNQTDQLRLLQVKTLPVEALALAVATEKSEDVETLAPAVFKHTVVLELEGSYFQVIDYLRRLEQLSWRFYWDVLDYRVSDYPRARVQLRVYTLSAEEGFVGV